MSLIFMHEVEKLKKQILSLSALVEENVIQAVSALHARDAGLAEKIIESDAEIDRLEVEVEEEGLKILALYQPVAMDLRFLTAVIKINNDLERIGDLAANIAARVVKMCREPALPIPEELQEAAIKAHDMLRHSLTAFVNLDAELASDVCIADDDVDLLCKKVKKFVLKSGQEKPENLNYYLTVLQASRNVERIGDHATNIAEDVIYLAEGKIVRHAAALDDDD